MNGFGIVLGTIAWADAFLIKAIPVRRASCSLQCCGCRRF